MMKVMIFAVLAAMLAISDARVIRVGSKTFTPAELFNMEPIIVGGTDAEKDEFPYQISYRADRKENSSHNCGGSIITEDWILIAAHCVEPKLLEPGIPTIIAGKLKLKEEKNQDEQERKGKLIIRHPKWDLDTLQNDIALIKLDKPLEFNKHVRPIKLATEDKDPQDQLLVSGWGLTEMGGNELPDSLQKANLDGVQRSLCAQIYQVVQIDVNIGHVCAGVVEGGIGACQGDSGGPLVVEGKDGNTQVGIVSFGLGCALPYIPGVYTNVAHHFAWIDQVIQNN